MTEATASANGGRPTVVLVHGGFGDSSSWAGMIAELQYDDLSLITALTAMLCTGWICRSTDARDYRSTRQLRGAVCEVLHRCGRSFRDVRTQVRAHPC